MSTTPYRLLLVDDHTMFRQGLRALLEDSGEVVVVGEATNGADAVDLASRLRPDVILMDIQMPGGDGLQAVRNIRQAVPDARIIMLTVHASDADLVYQSIQAGAMGYVSKISDVQELVTAISQVAQGQASIAASSLTSLLTFISSGSSGGIGNGKSSDHERIPDALSEREQEVLDLVAEGKSNREIADQLFISESTVRSHLHNILDKLHLSNRVQAATYTLGNKRRREARSKV